MNRLDLILVVLDPHQEDQPALDRAAYIAESTGASLHLFMCAYDTAVGIATFLTGGQKTTLIQTIVDGSEVLVDRLAKPLIERGITCTHSVVWDRHQADAILAETRGGEFDLMMKQAQHSNRAESMFNNVDWTLMRYSPCPVMLVKDGQWDEVGQVLAAVDAAPESDQHHRLNEAVLSSAEYLARVLDFELHLVSAYPSPPVFAPVSVAVQTQINYREKMKSMVEENLTAMASAHDVMIERVHAIEGPVDWVVSSVSKDLVAEFVVMGNVSREGETGLSIGSTAESTLDSLNTNVLMVKVKSEG